MVNKRKIKRTIDIIFWTIIIINTIIEMYKTFTGSVNVRTENINLSILVSAIGIFTICFIISILKMPFIVMLYIGYKIAYIKYYKDKLDETDLKNNGYYREIIQKYSPAVLSYIDDFKLDKKLLLH